MCPADVLCVFAWLAKLSETNYVDYKSSLMPPWQKAKAK